MLALILLACVHVVASELARESVLADTEREQLKSESGPSDEELELAMNSMRDILSPTPTPARIIHESREATALDLAQDEAQSGQWAYAQKYEATGEGSSLQAVTSAASALLIDESKCPWQFGSSAGSRIQGHPRLARAARDAIHSSTSRSSGVAADAHVLLYFLRLPESGNNLAFHHISKAIELRPHHGRQWMHRATQHIRRGDWEAALEDSVKSRDYASDEYERWERDLNVGKCLVKIRSRRHEARGVLEPLVNDAFRDDNKLSLNDRDRKDAVGAQFMLVELAFEEGDADAASAHHETATRRWKALPAKLQASVGSVKAMADLAMQSLRLHRPSAYAQKPAKRLRSQGRTERSQGRTEDSPHAVEVASSSGVWHGAVALLVVIVTPLAGLWWVLGRAALRAECQLWFRTLWAHLTNGEAANNQAGEPARRGRRDRARQGRGGGRRAAGGQQPAPRAVQPTDRPEWWIALGEYQGTLEHAVQLERPDFLCPITGEIMRRPVLLVDGRETHHTYEHDAISGWFASGGTTDPNSRHAIDLARYSLVDDKRLVREIRNYCEGKVCAWRQELTAARGTLGTTDVARSVHVFVDHSNAVFGASRAGTRLDVGQLVDHVEGARDVKERVVIGSRGIDRTRSIWEQLGYSVSADSRRGPERFVDDALHAQLMRTAAKRFEPPRVIALVTGDGNSNEGRTTFPECVEEALRLSWHVELYAWRSSTSQVYCALAKQYAPHFTIHYLDELGLEVAEQTSTQAAEPRAISYADLQARWTKRIAELEAALAEVGDIDDWDSAEADAFGLLEEECNSLKLLVRYPKEAASATSLGELVDALLAHCDRMWDENGADYVPEVRRALSAALAAAESAGLCTDDVERQRCLQGTARVRKEADARNDDLRCQHAAATARLMAESSDFFSVTPPLSPASAARRAEDLSCAGSVLGDRLDWEAVGGKL